MDIVTTPGFGFYLEGRPFQSPLVVDLEAVMGVIPKIISLMRVLGSFIAIIPWDGVLK
jgi:hypothetical protein